MSGWRFPPNTREVQFDETWSFVFKKPEHCDPEDPADDHPGDWWDHVALDPESRLVLAVVPGARDAESVEGAHRLDSSAPADGDGMPPADGGERVGDQRASVPAEVHEVVAGQ